MLQILGMRWGVDWLCGSQVPLQLDPIIFISKVTTLLRARVVHSSHEKSTSWLDHRDMCLNGRVNSVRLLQMTFVPSTSKSAQGPELN